jgi:hypothetical protein
LIWCSNFDFLGLSGLVQPGALSYTKEVVQTSQDLELFVKETINSLVPDSGGKNEKDSSAPETGGGSKE